MIHQPKRKLGLVGGFSVVSDCPAYDRRLQLVQLLVESGFEVLCEAEPEQPLVTLVQGVEVYGGTVTFADQYLLSIADAAERLQAEKMHFYNMVDELLVLPGGLKSLDKLTEYLTWMPRIHGVKPVAVIDEGGFWLPLLALFSHIEAEGFLPVNFRERFQYFPNLSDFIENLKARQ